MNILPKKRWHVRTRDNINRVRRDEAKAAEELKEKERRVKLAEKEARTNLLRVRARSKINQDPTQESLFLDSSSNLKHVNFFEHLEAGESCSTENEEKKAQDKKDREDWEKKVGILTYLGQGDDGGSSWWNLESKKQDSSVSEKNEAIKDSLDPLKNIRGYLKCDGIKSVTSNKRTLSDDEDRANKKRKKSKKKKSKKKYKKKSKKKRKNSSSSEDSSGDEEPKNITSIERLRKERLEREKKERLRETRLLDGLDPDPIVEEVKTSEKVSQKYNSQFNPQYSKQNKLDSKTKYWLN